MLNLLLDVKVTEEPAETTTTSPWSEVVVPRDEEDKSQNTGIVLVVAPLVAATITVVVSGKRK